MTGKPLIGLHQKVLSGHERPGAGPPALPIDGHRRRTCTRNSRSSSPERRGSQSRFSRDVLEAA